MVTARFGSNSGARQVLAADEPVAREQDEPPQMLHFGSDSEFLSNTSQRTAAPIHS
jgi:hypothetical protein